MSRSVAGRTGVRLDCHGLWLPCATCGTVSHTWSIVRALRVALTDTLAYWTVVDDDWRPVPTADADLRHLRLGADRAEGTTRTYAGDLACYLSWCERSGRDRVVLAGLDDDVIAEVLYAVQSALAEGRRVYALDPAARGRSPAAVRRRHRR